MNTSEHVAYIGDRCGATGFLSGDLSKRDHVEDVDGKMILKSVFKSRMGRHGLDLFVLLHRELAGYGEHGNERSIK
jgi:hypothetical protein